MTVISIVTHAHLFVVGVDTHARNHVYAILAAATGALLDTHAFPTTVSGISRAINWVARRTGADADTLWVIEGAASYGGFWPAPWTATDIRWQRHRSWMPRSAEAWRNPTLWMPTKSPLQRYLCRWRSYVDRGSMTGSARHCGSWSP